MGSVLRRSDFHFLQLCYNQLPAKSPPPKQTGTGKNAKKEKTMLASQAARNLATQPLILGKKLLSRRLLRDKPPVYNYLLIWLS